MPKFKDLVWKEGFGLDRALGGMPEFGIDARYVISQDEDKYRADCYTDISVFSNPATHHKSLQEAKAYCELCYQLSMQNLFNAMRERIEKGSFGALINADKEEDTSESRD